MSKRFGGYWKERYKGKNSDIIEKCKRDLQCTFDELAALGGVSRRWLLSIANDEGKRRISYFTARRFNEAVTKLYTKRGLGAAPAVDYRPGRS